MMPEKNTKDGLISRKYILYLGKGYKKVGLLNGYKLNHLTKLEILRLLVKKQNEFLKRIKCQTK